MKKYLINNVEFNKEEFYDKLYDEIEVYVDKHYDDMLDERFGKINIAGCDFDASRILREIDPILYNCYIDNLIDEIYGDYKYQLENNNHIFYIKITNAKFEVKE